MEPSRSNLKRSFEDDDDDMSGKPPPAKKVRFPKGKKVKPEAEQATTSSGGGEGIGPAPLTDPNIAAKERAKRRSAQISELCKDDDASAAEVTYRGIDYDNFVEDGVQFEPFNLEKEREEGYFDADGNFVEYLDENQVKDAWLDSITKAVDAETTRKFEERNGAVSAAAEEEDEDGQGLELTSEEIGRIKRRIADALESEETVLQALRRLKGNKKEKMSAEKKKVFDQLTEDALVLMMKNGENNVYDEEKEVFEREAQGYESLAKARLGEGKSILEELEADPGASNSIASISGGGGNSNVADDDDAFDMFGDDDVPAAVANQAASGDATGPENNGGETDYVFDEASGYYYSSSSGYYYDSTSGMYCSAVTGLWYSYNEETGAYDEVAHQAAEATEAAAAAVN